ncbi:mycofactocin system GMC family oxidoreductase MftG [Nocardia sp. 348MFTsu5.1]|uniref:mycofactocin system GMC family oxidoreductase MftG n=1 Tax=Nocardia sp. 348MFTsu5.1 TaxID=1172185 RepID=UPI001E617DA6|nr:mycofactocin system GMC family oxidoreductase MftG [Nocardia sp. 348MFTsu5.1]
MSAVSAARSRLMPGGADVIVVGAGSSGCVVAERLSRDPARRVLWLEAGGDKAAATELRLDRLPVAAGSQRVVHYPSRQGFDLPRGRGLGGSSAVNGGYFMRWHKADFAGWPWPQQEIAAAYDRLDGGEAGGGSMHVAAFADDELHEYARAFENHWHEQGFGDSTAPWPDVGVVRVRSNRDGWLRRSAAESIAQRIEGRKNLQLMTDSEVIGLRRSGDRVTAVVVGEQVIAADEVILCAGTLGTAQLLARSGIVGAQSIGVWEHREVLVRFTPATPPAPAARALLQSVLHTDDGIEIRCYNGDFADFISGVPATGPAMGVALMHTREPGSIAWDLTSGLVVDLGEVSRSDREKLAAWAERVREMLDGPRFAALVDRSGGGAVIDSVVRTSQHAWGTLPMGVDTDWLGRVTAVSGLRVLDASILPTAGSSGPHATVMMVASYIADQIA